MYDALITCLKYCGLTAGKTLQIGTALPITEEPLLSLLGGDCLNYTGQQILSKQYDIIISLVAPTILRYNALEAHIANCCPYLSQTGMIVLGVYLYTTKSRNNNVIGHTKRQFNYDNDGTLVGIDGTVCIGEEAFRKTLGRHDLILQNFLSGNWSILKTSVIDIMQDVVTIVRAN